MTSAGSGTIAERYRGKRVLVTGASGFLGQHIVDQLAALDCRVLCVSRRPRSDSRGKVTWLEADLSDRASAARVIRQAEASIVFHVAGESKGDQKVENVVDCFKNDLEATVNCLLAVHQLGGCDKFVMTGSLEEPALPNDDDAEPVPLSPYAAAKFASGFYGKMFHRLYDVPVVILRPFMTYGPGQKEHKVIPYTILSLLRGEPALLSSGDRMIDWIYAADVADAFVRAGIAPHAAGRTLDIGSQQGISLRIVAEKIHSLTGGPRPVFGAMPNRGLTRIADCREAARVLNWRPRTGLDEGLRKTVEWYRKQAGRC